MPWSVVKGGGNCAADKFAVVNKQTGKTMGCHDSKASANKQLAALNANVDETEDHMTDLYERDFSPEARKRMAKSGSAMPDESFPIPDVDALKRAIQSIGRAKDPARVKAHIRKRAKALGAEGLIPDSWGSKESESTSAAHSLTESVALSEASDVATMTASGRMVVRAISAGVGSSGYYSPAVIESAARQRLIRRGTPLHVDHPSESERHDRPERSVATIAAVFTDDAAYDPATESLVGPVQVFPPYKERLKEMAPYIGLSISGSATDIVEGEHDGRRVQIIEGLHSIDSVDFVTRAARGGEVLLAESERPADALTAHIDATFGQALRESGLHIVPVTDPAGQTTTTESLGGTMAKIEIEESEHQRLVDEAGRVKTLESERDAAVKEAEEAKAEAEKSKPAAGSPRAVMQAEIKQAHREVAEYKARDRARVVLAEEFAQAMVSDLVKHRLTESLMKELPIVNDDLDESTLRDTAVKERDQAEMEAGQILESAGMGRPRGLGASQPVGEGAVDTERSIKNFQRLGLTEAEAAIAAKGR